MADKDKAEELSVELKAEAPELPKPKKPESKPMFFGVTADRLPEHLRPAFDRYASIREDLAKKRGAREAQGLPQIDKYQQRIDRLTEVRSLLPSEQAREEMQKALRAKRTFFQGGFGQTLLDDKNKRLSMVIEKQGLEDNEENREKVLSDLIESAKSKVGYDSANPLFNPDKPDHIDDNAAQLLQIWSMENLTTKFDSATDLYQNFGKVLENQNKLEQEAQDLLDDRMNNEKPEQVSYAILNGKKVSAVPKYNEAVNKSLAESTNNNLLRLLYSDSTSSELLRMYAEGMEKGQSREELEASLGNKTDAEYVMQNAFYSKADARPSEVYTPIDMTADGRFAINRRAMQLGIENYIFHDKVRRLGKTVGDLSEDEREKIRESARNRTRVLTNSYLDADSLVVHKDPDGALRNYLEGKGGRAATLQVMKAINTAVTLGQKERIMSNLPDRIARSIVALTLPRRAAGIVSQKGEELDFVRGGEFFAPGFGDTGVSNALDYVLRLSLDEPLTKSFALAVDDEAKERNKEEGRGNRIVQKMLANVGTDRHIAYMVKDEHSGGRFLTEFGDAFINPVLKSHGVDAPIVGDVVGGITAMGIFLLSPDALMAGGIAGGAAGKLGKAAKIGLNLTRQGGILKGGEGALRVLDGSLNNSVGVGAKGVQTPEQVTEVAEVMNEAARRDLTGGIATIGLLAAASTTMRHGLQMSLKTNGAVKRVMKFYTNKKEEAGKLFSEAKKDKDKAATQNNAAKKLNLNLGANQKEIRAVENALDAEKSVTETMHAFAKDEQIRKRLQNRVKNSVHTDPEDALFIADAFRTLRGEMTMTALAETYKLTDGLKLREGALGTAQLRAVVTQRMREIFGKADMGKKSSAVLKKHLPDYARMMSMSTDALVKLDDVVKRLAKEASDQKKVLEALKKSDTAPALVKALGELYDVNFTKLTRLQGELRKTADQVRATDARAEVIAKLSPEELDKFVVDEFNEYLRVYRSLAQGAVRAGKLKNDVFESALNATIGRSRKVFGDEVLKAGKEEFKDLAEKLAPLTEGVEPAEAATTLYKTKALVEIFSDPYGLIQLDVRGGPNAARRLLTNPKALYVWGTLHVAGVLRKYPFFTTNIRYLETTVQREIDDSAKAIARRNQDLIDSIDLIYDNIDDLAEANRVVNDLLTSPGKLIEITSKYNLPFTRGSKISISGIVGRRQSIAVTFLDAVRNESVVKRAARAVNEESLTLGALDIAIKAFVSDRKIIGRGEVLNADGAYAVARSQIVSEITRRYDELLTDVAPDELLETLEDIITRNLAIGNKAKGGNRGIATVSSEDPVKMADARGKMYKALIAGAGQKDLLDRIAMVIGPRFNTRMGRAMNNIAGMGQEAADTMISSDFMVGDYVVFADDIASVNRLFPAGRAEGSSTIAPAIHSPPQAGSVLAMRSPTETIASLIREVPATAKGTPQGIMGDTYKTLSGGRILKDTPVHSAYDVTRWFAENALSEEYARLFRAILPYVDRETTVYLRPNYKNAHSAGLDNHLAFDPKLFNEEIYMHELMHSIMSTSLDGAKVTPGGKAVAKKYNQFYEALKAELKPYIKAKGGGFRFTERGNKIIKALDLTAAEKEALKGRLQYMMYRSRAELQTVPFESNAIRDFLSAIRVDVGKPLVSPEKFKFLDAVFRDFDDSIRDGFKDILRHNAALAYHRKVPDSTPPVGPLGRRTRRSDVDTTDIPGTTTRDPVSGKKGIFPKGTFAARTRPQAAGRAEQIRLPALEAKALEGRPAFRINKIEVAPDGTERIYLNTGDKGAPLIVTKAEIAHRDVSLSMLDALDGFSIWGMETITNIGRKDRLTDELKNTRTGFRRMVAASTDEAGNLQMVPASIMDNVIESLQKIEKEIDEAISKEAASPVQLSGMNMYRRFLRFFKTHILTGLFVPRPAYFMNQAFGDFSQMIIAVGLPRAASLTFMGSLAYVPVFGPSMQNAWFRTISRLPPGRKGLPTAMSSIFNANIDKILRGGDEIIEFADGTRKTAGEFLAEALESGIGENIRVQDFSRKVRRTLQLQKRNDLSTFEALEKAGQDMTYMQNVMELKIREVSRRQRLLFYADARLNRGLSIQDSRKELANTLYDWTHSVGKHEMEFIGRHVLFYTLSKNAMAQVFRMFFEFSDVGVKEYMKRYAKGGTQLQRFELISRLMTQFPAFETRPFEDLSPEEQRERASMMNLPDYLKDYPLLDLNALSPEALAIMSEGGFIRRNYARVLPKATATEYMISLLDMSGSLFAMAIAGGNILDPEGKVIPFSADADKAFDAMIDATVDQYMTPMYADLVEDMVRSFTGREKGPTSQYGRRAKPGDMATLELLGRMGLADTVATVTDDPRDKRTKRIAYRGGPIVDQLVRIPQTEFHRFRMGLALVFPGMAPAEIRALAANDPTASARLEALGQLINLNKAVFYNGEDERYFELDDIRDRFSKQRGLMKRQANTKIVPE